MAESRSHRAENAETPAKGRLTIGEAAARTGLSPKMIRYYEQEGLFVPLARSAAGYRQYGKADLHALRFIRSARDLGFSLKQIAELTGLWHDRARASAEVKRLALAHIESLEAKAALLRGMASTLRELAQRCHGDDRPECPILEGLEGGACDQSSGACHTET
ncbi:MAG: Cu(I)-responsive transcriptional regulator [Castellaniella sp.]|uniref:Cu(I)-responsive transcriptional regulator n=1 Tax=Castellaniella sp. TaxID=1955812 RepID=UPI003A85FBC2